MTLPQINSYAKWHQLQFNHVTNQQPITEPHPRNETTDILRSMVATCPLLVHSATVIKRLGTVMLVLEWLVYANSHVTNNLHVLHTWSTRLATVQYATRPVSNSLATVK